MSITVVRQRSTMRAKVPVRQWLSMTASLKQRHYMSLANNRIEDGFVLFDDKNLHILEMIIDQFQTAGGCPSCKSKLVISMVSEGMMWGVCTVCDARWNPNQRTPDYYEGRVPVYEKPKKNKKYANSLDARTLSTVLEGWHRKDSNWFACRCPVHKGVSANSMIINAQTGAYGCHQGCDNADIYAALKELKDEATPSSGESTVPPEEV